MKLMVEFELDTAGLDAYDTDDTIEIPAVVENICSWLNGLYLFALDGRLEAALIKDPMKQATTDKACKQDITLSKQIFDNLTLEFTTSKGITLTYTHRNPGHRVEYILNGQLMSE